MSSFPKTVEVHTGFLLAGYLCGLLCAVTLIGEIWFAVLAVLCWWWMLWLVGNSAKAKTRPAKAKT